MVIKILSLDGDIDIFGMNFKRMVPRNVKNIGMPVDVDMLCDIGHVQGEMNEVYCIIDRNIGSLKFFNELVDHGATIYRDFLVKELSWSD